MLLERFERFELHGIDEHFSGLAAVRRTDDALIFQHIHYTPGAGVSHFEATLDIGRGTQTAGHHQLGRLPDERIVVGARAAAGIRWA